MARTFPWSVGVLLAPLVAYSLPAQAVEFGIFRALQHGAIGDAPQFADFDKYEAEAAVRLCRVYGKQVVNDQIDSKVDGNSVRTTVAAGGALMASKSFGLSAAVDMTVASDYDERADRATPKTSIDGGVYKHSLNLNAFFKEGIVAVGGGLGVMVIGSEDRLLEVTDDDYTNEVTSAAMPVMHLFGGITSKMFDISLGFRLFSMGEAVVSSDVNKTKAEYDIVRRNPGELHVDAKLKFGQAAVAGAIRYVLTGQASEQLDEFSTRYEVVGTNKTRVTGGARRNADHVELGVGGRFDPNKMIGVLGGIEYIGSSYAKDEYASLEAENLGGLRFDLGTEVHVQKIRGFFEAGYLLDSTTSFTESQDDRGLTAIDRTLKSPLNKGDKVKITQGRWDVALGGGMSF